MTKEPTMVRAGDTLLVCVAHQVSNEDAERLIEDLQRGLPGVKVALMEGVTDLAVFRPAPPVVDGDGAT